MIREIPTFFYAQRTAKRTYSHVMTRRDIKTIFKSLTDELSKARQERGKGLKATKIVFTRDALEVESEALKLRCQDILSYQKLPGQNTAYTNVYIMGKTKESQILCIRLLMKTENAFRCCDLLNRSFEKIDVRKGRNRKENCRNTGSIKAGNKASSTADKFSKKQKEQEGQDIDSTSTEEVQATVAVSSLIPKCAQSVAYWTTLWGLPEEAIPSGCTMFAPADVALINLLCTGWKAPSDETSKPELMKLFKSFIVKGIYSREDLRNHQRLKTLDGGHINIHVDDSSGCVELVGASGISSVLVESSGAKRAYADVHSGLDISIHVVSQATFATRKQPRMRRLSDISNVITAHARTRKLSKDTHPHVAPRPRSSSFAFSNNLANFAL